MLGIGTTSPSKKLVVAGGADSISGIFAGGTSLLRLEGNNAAFSEPALEFAEQTNPPMASIAAKNTGAGAGDLIFLTREHPASAPTEKLRILNNGNIGVGTTSPAAKLEVLGGSTVLSSAGDARALGVRYGGGDHVFYIGATQASNTNGAIRSNLVFTEAGGAERMRIEGLSGNVGIGTTNPAYALSVTGDITASSRLAVSDSFVAGYTFQNGGRTLLRNNLEIANGVITNGNYSAYSFLSLPSDPDGWKFYTTNTSKNAGLMRLHIGAAADVANFSIMNSNVGVGTTNPAAKLDVTGNIKVNSAPLPPYFANGSIATYNPTGDGNNGTGVVITTPENSFGGLVVGYATSAPQKWLMGISNNLADRTGLVFYEDAEVSKPRLTVATGGNVGIGTTSPMANLHIVNKTTGNQNGIVLENNVNTNPNEDGPYLTFQYDEKTASPVESGDTIGGIRFRTSYLADTYSGVGASIKGIQDGSVSATSSPGALLFSTTADGSSALTERLRITNTGNVGIGTTFPSYKLDINGGFRAINSTLTTIWTERGDSDVDIVQSSSSTKRALSVHAGALGGSPLSIYAHNGSANIISLFSQNGTGNVGIGTTLPGASFAVNGVIHGQASANAGDVLQVGNDTFLSDINVPNTVNLQGAQDRTVATLKLGTGGGSLSGYSGNVGIGTSAASGTLTVSGTNGNVTSGAPLLRLNDITTGQYLGIDNGNNANALRLINPTGPLELQSSSNANQISLATNGDVGIGTNSPTDLLHVAGRIRSNDYVETINGITGNLNYTAGFQYRTNGYGYYLGMRADANYAFMSVYPSGTAGTAGTAITAMAWSSSGNVGIGTTSPSYPLEVTGGILNSASGSAKILLGSVSSFPGIWFGASSGAPTVTNYSYLYDTNSGKGPVFNAPSAGSMAFRINNADKLRMSALGGFAIGSTFADSNTPVEPGANNLIVQGNVGIGTTAPGYLLDVNGAMRSTIGGGGSVGHGGRIYFGVQQTGTTFDHAFVSGYNEFTGDDGSGTGSRGSLIFATKATTGATAATEKMRIDRNGNVGIGTANPGARLDLGSTSAAAKLLLYNNAGDQYGFGINGGELNVFSGSGGNINFRTGGAAGTSSLYLKANGNIGIGTITPNYPLHVMGGSGAIEGTGTATLNLRGNGNSNWWSMNSTGSGIDITSQNSSVVPFASDNSGNLSLAKSASGIPAIYAQASVNVGIGTTSPQALLHLGLNAGEIRIGSNFGSVATDAGKISWVNTSGGSWELAQIKAVSTSAGSYGALVFSTGKGTSATEKMRIDDNGNVGVGTSAPTEVLDVQGGYGSGLKIRGPTVDSNWYGGIQLTNSTNAASGAVLSASVNGLFFNYGGSERMRIANGGNVGVGTTNPSAKLELTGGSIKISTLGEGIGIAPGGSASRDITWDGNGTVLRDTGYFSFIADTNNDASGGFSFYKGANAAAGATSLMTIGLSGNVGVGTNAPSDLLHLGGATNGNARIRFTSIGGGGGRTWSVGTNGNASNADPNFGLTFRDETGGLDRMTISWSTGNVGIGTNLPSGKLDVNGGNLIISNDSAVSLGLVFKPTDLSASYPNSADERQFQWMTTGLTDGSLGYKFSWRNANGTSRLGAMSFNRNGQVYFDGGNVGIGTTSAEDVLHLSKAASATLQFPLRLQNLDFSNTPGTATGIAFKVTPVADQYKGGIAFERITTYGLGKMHFLVNNTADSLSTTLADSRMTIDRTGNVGIGVTSPSSTLEVRGPIFVKQNSDDWGLRFSRTDDSWIAGIKYVGHPGAGRMDFLTHNTERFTIGVGGSVGIGTTNPVTPLDVIGTVRATASASTPTISALSLTAETYTPTVQTYAKRSSNAELQAGDWLGIFDFRNRDYNSSARIYSIASETHSATAAGADLIFATTPSTTTAVTEKMRIANNGYVGVGTTSPQEKLQVGPGGHGFHTGGALAHFFNIYYNSGTKFGGYGGTQYGGSIDFSPANGGFSISSTSAAGVADATATLLTKMTILNSGNTGIRTTCPIHTPRA